MIIYNTFVFLGKVGIFYLYGVFWLSNDHKCIKKQIMYKLTQSNSLNLVILSCYRKFQFALTEWLSILSFRKNENSELGNNKNKMKMKMKIGDNNVGKFLDVWAKTFFFWVWNEQRLFLLLKGYLTDGTFNEIPRKRLGLSPGPHPKRIKMFFFAKKKESYFLMWKKRYLTNMGPPKAQSHSHFLTISFPFPIRFQT